MEKIFQALDALETSELSFSEISELAALCLYYLDGETRAGAYFDVFACVTIIPLVVAGKVTFANLPSRRQAIKQIAAKAKERILDQCAGEV